MRTDQEYLENVERPTMNKIHEVCLICGKPQSPEHAKTHIEDIGRMVIGDDFVMPAFGLGEE